MQSMIRATSAAGKGQLLKASTRAVPLGTASDISEPASLDHTTVVPVKGRKNQDKFPQLNHIAFYIYF